MNTLPRLDFVVIGAQKAGSTFLQEAIGAHPDVYTPHGETPYFEDPDYDPDDASALRAALARAKPHQRRGIKRPNYLCLPEVPERIARHAPACGLIAVLRDPRWRAVSAYFHLMRSGLLPVRPLDPGMLDILDGKLDRDYPAARQLIDFGRYAAGLDRFLEHFPRERLHVVLYEDIRSRPVELAREAYAFLGIDKAHDPSEAAGARPMPGVYSLPRQRFVAAFHRMSVEYYHGRTRIRSRGGVRGAVSRAVGLLDRFALSRVFANRRPSPSPEIWSRLTETYAADIAALKPLLGRSLASWQSPLPPPVD